MVCGRTERMLVHILSSLSTWFEVTVYHISMIKCCGCYLFHCAIYRGYYSRVATVEGHCILNSAWISELFHNLKIMALRKACYVRMVIMLLHGAEVKLQASLFVPLPCYKALHTRYHFLAFFQWIHKSLTLCVSQSFLDRFGEHDQQSILLSSCSKQKCLGHTCHEVILVLLK